MLKVRGVIVAESDGLQLSLEPSCALVAQCAQCHTGTNAPRRTLQGWEDFRACLYLLTVPHARAHDPQILWFSYVPQQIISDSPTEFAIRMLVCETGSFAIQEVHEAATPTLPHPPCEQ